MSNGEVERLRALVQYDYFHAATIHESRNQYLKTDPAQAAKKEMVRRLLGVEAKVVERRALAAEATEDPAEMRKAADSLLGKGRKGGPRYMPGAEVAAEHLRQRAAGVPAAAAGYLVRSRAVVAVSERLRVAEAEVAGKLEVYVVADQKMRASIKDNYMKGSQVPIVERDLKRACELAKLDLGSTITK